MRQIVRFFKLKFAIALLGGLWDPMTCSALLAQQSQPGAGYTLQGNRFAGQAAAAPQGTAQPGTAQPFAGQQQQAQQPQAQQPQIQQELGQRVAGQQYAPQQYAGQQAAGQQAAGQAVPGQSVQGQAVQGQAVQGAMGQAGNEPSGIVNPVAPFPPLNAEWQAYLDKVLDAWEKKTGDFGRFSCNFVRHQFDPTLVQNFPYTMAFGSIKYMKPDQGLFRADQLVYYSGLDKDQKPQYKENPQKKFGEYWICDGQYVHVLDQNEKKCTKYELPPAMRGNTIYMSPLPFLFGVKAQDIKSRYWVRPLPLPEGRTNEVWLEAFPRRADDASNYQKVQVVLDLKDFMPKGLIVFLPNWREEAQHREVYEFKDRRTNETLLEKLDLFKKEFIPKELPQDWKVIVEPYQAPQAVPTAETPRVAAPPAAATAPVR